MLYIVTGPRFCVPVDTVINLSPKQYSGRSHRVAIAEGGYRVLEMIEFKKGEIIDIVDGKMDKNAPKSIKPYREMSKVDRVDHSNVESPLSPAARTEPVRLDTLKQAMGAKR